MGVEGSLRMTSVKKGFSRSSPYYHHYHCFAWSVRVCVCVSAFGLSLRHYVLLRGWCALLLSLLLLIRAAPVCSKTCVSNKSKTKSKSKRSVERENTSKCKLERLCGYECESLI